jgi:adenylate kinase
MPSIKFTEIELEFLRNHYEQELIDAEMYVAEIRRILSKMGKSKAETILGKPEKKRRGRPSKKNVAAAEATAPAPAPKKEKKASKPRKKKAKSAKGKAEPKPVVKKAVKKTAPKKKAPKKAVKPAEIATPAEQSA